MQAYLDLISGISGDMFVGAMIDLGVPVKSLEAQLRKMKLGNYSISAKKVRVGPLAATRFNVRAEGKQPERNLGNIETIIRKSGLGGPVVERAVRAFRMLAAAEARVHGTTPSKIHFHEVGAVDSIIDIVGAAVCMELLGITGMIASEIPLGRGTVRCAHGVLPLPAPATLELLRGKPVRGVDESVELVTPTGAAILAVFVDSFGQMPAMKISGIGTGAGTHEAAGRPNVLRIIAGSPAGNAPSVIVMEANIDDMSPALYENLVEKLFAAGARDVYMENIYMKKTRPGIKISVILDEKDMDEIKTALFSESTTIGARFHTAQRLELERETRKVSTPHGEVRVKFAREGSRLMNASLEYEDLKAISMKKGIPLKRLYAELGYLLKEQR